MKTVLPVFFLMAILISSCKEKGGFTVEGKIKNYEDGEILIINLQDNESKDTIKVKNGKFTYEGKVDEPTPFMLLAPDILPSQSIFYADKGKVTISFTARDPNSFVVKGCATQKEYEDFYSKTKSLLVQFDSIQNLAFTGGDQFTQADIEKAIMDIQEKYEAVNMQFVKENKSSYVSALLAYEYIRQKPSLTITEKRAIREGLDPIIQSSYYGLKMNELLASEKNTVVGGLAPAFTLSSPEGKSIELASFKGKYVLIDFWASWCAPCRAENPNVVLAYARFKKKNFEIIGVSLDENKDQWLAAIKKDKLGWTHVSDLDGWNSKVVSLYNIRSIPSNVLVDPEGKIIAKDLRGADLENKLAAVLK